MSVVGCDLGPGQCFSTQEEFRNSIFNLLYINNYIDFDESRENVIKSEPESKHFVSLDPNRMQNIDLFYSKSTVLLQDSVFKLFDADKNNEIHILQQQNSFSYQEYITQDTKLEDREYAKFFLRADSLTKKYSRENYSILEYLGDLGGLLDILNVVGMILTSVIIDKLWFGQLIREVYYIHGYSENKSNKVKRNQTVINEGKWDTGNISPIQNRITMAKHNSEGAHAKVSPNLVMTKELLKEKMNELDVKFRSTNKELTVTKEDKEVIKTSILNLQSFHYEFRNVIDYFLKCLCRRSKKQLWDEMRKAEEKDKKDGKFESLKEHY